MSVKEKIRWLDKLSIGNRRFYNTADIPYITILACNTSCLVLAHLCRSSLQPATWIQYTCEKHRRRQCCQMKNRREVRYALYTFLTNRCLPVGTGRRTLDSVDNELSVIIGMSVTFLYSWGTHTPPQQLRDVLPGSII